MTPLSGQNYYFQQFRNLRMSNSMARNVSKAAIRAGHKGRSLRKPYETTLLRKSSRLHLNYTNLFLEAKYAWRIASRVFNLEWKKKGWLSCLSGWLAVRAASPKIHHSHRLRLWGSTKNGIHRSMRFFLLGGSDIPFPAILATMVPRHWICQPEAV